MDRRTAIKSIAAAGAVAGGLAGLPAQAADRGLPAILKPKRLREGMTVGLIAPAGASNNRQQVLVAQGQA